MDTASQTLNRRVSDSFRASGLALNALAEAAGIPRTTLRRKLSGAAEFTITELIRLAIALDADLDAWTVGLVEVVA